VITRFLVYRYALEEDGVWSTSPETVEEVYDVAVTTAMGDTKDTFSFKVPNPRGTFKQQFNHTDIIAIYYIINNETPSTSNLVLYGLIKKVTEETNDKGKFIRVEGVSFGEITTTALVFYDPGTNTQNVIQYLQSCLTSVALRNENFNITWNSGNPTVKTDGSAFPTFTSSATPVKDFDKSFSSLLDKYLTDQYTDDGRYFWYVNNLKELVIRSRKTDTPVVSFTEGSNFKYVKFNIDTSDVKNFIIVKCGLDYNNDTITTRFDDAASRAKNGFRYYMIVDTNIAKDLKKGNAYDGDNEGLRNAAKDEGYARAADFAAAHNKGILEATLTLAPTTNYTVGDTVLLNTTSYATKDFPNGFSSYPMRIKEIRYAIDGVLLTLIEEVATA
jgi:hypothetical protein